MSPERLSQPAPKRPFEIYGFNERERLNWRVSNERLEEIINDDRTMIHNIQLSTNSFGEFLFITTSRPSDRERIAMTFSSLGYHEQRERWLTKEWFWYQSETYPKMIEQKVEKEKAKEQIRQRLESLLPYFDQPTQTRRGEIFELLADLTDEDGALAEMEDLESLADWIFDVDQLAPPRRASRDFSRGSSHRSPTHRREPS
jgi:hypothetical protein